MKILIIITNFQSGGKWHQGVASLATLLRVSGYTADLYQPDTTDVNKIIDDIKAYQPDVLAASANSNQFTYILEILNGIKKSMPHVYTVIGGVHTTIVPESISLLGNIDAICRGEGERPLLEVVKHLDEGKIPENIDNFIFNFKDGSVENKQKYYVQDLSALPIADRNLFKIFRESDRNVPLDFNVRFLFCRGCPFNCSYCCNKSIKDQFPSKKYVRWVDVDRAIEELEVVSDQFNFNSYVIDDDVFTLKKKWTLEFCNKYPELLKRNKKFAVNIRPGTVDDDVMYALSQIGCERISMGLESGDEIIRDNILNRKMSDEKIIYTAELAKKHGIRVNTFNMVGLPTEDFSSIMKTVKLNRIIKPDTMQVTTFYPYKHTELGDYCHDKGMVKSESGSYFGETTLQHDKMKASHISFYSKYFSLLVAVGISPSRTISILKSYKTFKVIGMVFTDPKQIFSRLFKKIR